MNWGIALGTLVSVCLLALLADKVVVPAIWEEAADEVSIDPACEGFAFNASAWADGSRKARNRLAAGLDHCEELAGDSREEVADLLGPDHARAGHGTRWVYPPGLTVNFGPDGTVEDTHITFETDYFADS
jgi:hypothetical protein